MDSQKYYKKYLKYKSKYYYLKYGGAASSDNPLKKQKVLTYPPANREDLIDEIKKDPEFFKNMKNVMQSRGNKGVLMSGQSWGNDPIRYTTEFLQRVVFQMRRIKRITGDNKTPKVSSSDSLLPKPNERETLIEEMGIWKFLFESEARKARDRGEDILEPGQQFGKDPNRFKTSFLQKVSKFIDKLETHNSGWSVEINEELKKRS